MEEKAIKMARMIDRKGILGYNIRKDPQKGPQRERDDRSERSFRKVEITKQSIIGDILDYAPETAQFFFAIGMHCLGCPASRGETVEDACAVHGTDADALIEQINEFLAKEGK